MIFHSVPLVFLAGIGAVGFSETRAVTGDGVEVLTRIPRRLHIVRNRRLRLRGARRSDLAAQATRALRRQARSLSMQEAMRPMKEGSCDT